MPIAHCTPADLSLSDVALSTQPDPLVFVPAGSGPSGLNMSPINDSRFFASFTSTIHQKRNGKSV